MMLTASDGSFISLDSKKNTKMPPLPIANGFGKMRETKRKKKNKRKEEKFNEKV